MRHELGFDLDAEAFEHDRAGIGRRRALGIEIDPLAGEVLELVDLRPHEHVHLGWKQRHDVVHALFQAADLGVGSEMLQHVAVDDRGIDAAQIQEIVDVVEDAARNYR